MSGPSNMSNFTTNSYNDTVKPASYCVKPGSMYTNKYANFEYFNFNKGRPANKQCGDPYTYYAYWYRRFPNEEKYNNCYYSSYCSYYHYNDYHCDCSQRHCFNHKHHLCHHHYLACSAFELYNVVKTDILNHSTALDCPMCELSKY